MKKIEKFVFAIMIAMPLAAVAADFESTPVVNVRIDDFAAGKEAIAERNWQAAVDAFSRAEKSDPRNADIQNYLGYSYRNLGKMELSFKHYNEALRLDPNHRGAHNYIGIAWLKSGKPERAEEHLARLEQICGKGCSEYADLSKAIAAHRENKPVVSSW